VEADIVEGREMLASPLLAHVGNRQRPLSVAAFMEKDPAFPEPVHAKILELHDDRERIVLLARRRRRQVVSIVAQPRDGDLRCPQSSPTRSAQ